MASKASHVVASESITLPSTVVRPSISIGVKHGPSKHESDFNANKHRLTVGEAAVRLIGRRMAMPFSMWLREHARSVTPRTIDEWIPLVNEFKNHSPEK